jgi:prephenate dehydratase
MIVAYQGVPGAFGHEAAGKVASVASLLAVPSFADVLAAVGAGRAGAGVLPVVNSRAGRVDGVANLIDDSGLLVQDTIDLPVRLHLLALPGATLGGIKTVVSHPMALRQCARRLAALGVEQRDASNTAVAAQSLADHRSAVLASSVAADLYGLAVLESDVQDDPDNVTRFAVLVRP